MIICNIDKHCFYTVSFYLNYTKSSVSGEKVESIFKYFKQYKSLYLRGVNTSSINPVLHVHS